MYTKQMIIIRKKLLFYIVGVVFLFETLIARLARCREASFAGFLCASRTTHITELTNLYRGTVLNGAHAVRFAFHIVVYCLGAQPTMARSQEDKHSKNILNPLCPQCAPRAARFAFYIVMYSLKRS